MEEFGDTVGVMWMLGMEMKRRRRKKKAKSGHNRRVLFNGKQMRLCRLELKLEM